MPLSAIHVETGEQIFEQHLNDRSSPGSEVSGNSNPYGAGLQDILASILREHHHVHPLLISSILPDYLQYTPYGVFGGTKKTASKYSYAWTGDLGVGTSELTQVYNHNNFAYYLGLVLVGGNLGGASLATFNMQSAATNYIQAFSGTNFGVYNVVGKPRRLYDLTSGFDPSVYNEYGFNEYTIFAGPINPDGIRLTNDVGGNATLLEHITDSTIHRRNVSVISNTSENDHLTVPYGYLNVYDIAEKSIDLTNPRKDGRSGDDYDFSPFGNYLGEYLGDSISSSHDISHPMLYEEGVYLWQAGILRIFKLIKADPDDRAVAVARVQEDPLDSLFVGGGSGTKSVAYSIASDRYLNVPNTYLDTYWYSNFYTRRNNREWKGGVGRFYYEEYIMFDALGYQPRRGLSAGI